ncbi:MAG: hypothetical protein E7385_05020 [Ruminococcaceae bacterium]|nr:hypothetical protein [Oscillospiraceae bacterium]
MKMKKIITVLLILMITISALASPFNAFAAEQSLQWSYIHMITFNIGFDGLDGGVYASCEFYPDCIYAEGRLTLYEYDEEYDEWVRIGMWLDSSVINSLDIYGEFEATYGAYYMATFWIKAYGSQYSYDEENLEDYSQCPYPSN